MLQEVADKYEEQIKKERDANSTLHAEREAMKQELQVELESTRKRIVDLEADSLHRQVDQKFVGLVAAGRSEVEKFAEMRDIARVATEARIAAESLLAPKIFECENLASQLEHARKTASADLARKNMECERLAQELAQAKEMASVSAEKSSATFQTVQKDLVAKSKELEKVSGEVVRTKTDASALRKDLSAKTQKLHDAHDRLRSQDAELECLRAEVSKIHAGKESSEVKMEETLAREAETVTELQASIDTLEEELGLCRRGEGDALERLATVQNFLSAERGAVAQLQDRVFVLEIKTREAENLRDSAEDAARIAENRLAEEKMKLEVALTRNKETVAGLQETNNQLERRLGELQGEVRQARIELDGVEISAKALSGSKQDVEAELEVSSIPLRFFFELGCL